jgi:DNA (cytosine-5)-methyltransferase 1
MRHLDLFSGIGGFALAAGWAGFETIGFAETDAYCSKILDLHWPGVVNYGDVRAIDGNQFQDVDLVTAGFPCQPFSCAGQRRGSSDERFLWPELARLLGEVRPRFALLENVPGILSLDGGRIFGRILGELAALGFDASWNCVPASAVGALHRRDRLWIVLTDSETLQRREVFGDEPHGILSGILSHADEQLLNGSGYAGPGGRIESANGSCELAHADDQRQWELQGRFEESRRRTGNGCLQDNGHVADANGTGSQGHGRPAERPGEWTAWQGSEPLESIWLTEPDVGRVASGIPKRVDRLRGLGNAIVPQVAYVFIAAIAQEIKICG